jgi:membrane protease YdiL (CAAX protease family)
MLGAAALVFLAVYAVSASCRRSAILARAGLTLTSWDSSRAVPFAVNFFVFVAVAPFVEELTFRGLGYSLLAPLGRLTAILWVGVAFDWHTGCSRACRS